VEFDVVRAVTALLHVKNFSAVRPNNPNEIAKNILDSIPNAIDLVNNNLISQSKDDKFNKVWDDLKNAIEEIFMLNDDKYPYLPSQADLISVWRIALPYLYTSGVEFQRELDKAENRLDKISAKLKSIKELYSDIELEENETMKHLSFLLKWKG